MGERPGFNPESMRPTPTSHEPVVIEANKVVFQAAQGVIIEEKKKPFWNRNGTLIVKATKFLSGTK